MAAPEYLTIVELPVAGSGGTFEFTFAGGYLEREHVKLDFVSPLGVRTNYPLNPITNFATDFTLTVPLVDLPADDFTARIYRDTPRADPLVNFASGSRITDSNLDRLAQQAIFVAAEAFDAGAYAVAEDLIGQALTAIEQTRALLGQAQVSADAAAASAADSSASADQALASANTALSHRDAAALSANAAAASESAVAASASAAAASASTASTKASEAAASATDAAGSASTATTQAGNSANSAADSASSAATASTQAANAATSATDAATSATNAANSASDAAADRALVEAVAANYPGRNKIINGKMEVAQRGTTFNNPTGQYTLDRWLYAGNAGNTMTVSRQADAPANTAFERSLRLVVGTPDTSIAAADNVTIGTALEGYDVRDLKGQTFTLSFWVKSPRTGTHCVSFRNGVADLSRVETYQITTADTWEFKTITVTGGLPATGTWDWANGLGLNVAFALAVGSNYQTTAGAWNSGNFLGTSAQANCVQSTNATFALTGVQLEVGTVATPFEHRAYETELSRCRRYTHVFSGFLGSTANASNVNNPSFRLVPRMRNTPAISGTFTPASGNAGTPGIFSGSGVAVTTDAVYVYNTAGNWTSGINVSADLVFNAEL